MEGWCANQTTTSSGIMANVLMCVQHWRGALTRFARAVEESGWQEEAQRAWLSQISLRWEWKGSLRYLKDCPRAEGLIQPYRPLTSITSTSTPPMPAQPHKHVAAYTIQAWGAFGLHSSYVSKTVTELFVCRTCAAVDHSLRSLRQTPPRRSYYIPHY